MMARTIEEEPPAGRGVRRVLVVGGRRLSRAGLRALLHEEPGIEVVGTCADDLTTRAALDDRPVDVIVAHPHLGDPAGGARLAVALHDEAPDVGVVLLLGDSDHLEVRTVLDRGTARRALLLLDHARVAADLVRAVHEVAAGGSFIHDGVVDLLLRETRRAGPDPVRLTPREAQVLEGIARGASNRRIAASLGASERAVEKHIHQLYLKLEIPATDGVHRRVLAARRALGLPALTSQPTQSGGAGAAGAAGAAGGATPDQVGPAPLAVS
jgi:DNA-binding NarL/FixJ family response regulator